MLPLIRFFWFYPSISKLYLHWFVYNSALRSWKEGASFYHGVDNSEKIDKVLQDKEDELPSISPGGNMIKLIVKFYR